MKFLSLALTALVLVACAAGADFSRVDYKQEVLGQTKATDIVQKLGSPFKTANQTKNGENVQIFIYSYAKAGGNADAEGVTPSRSQIFYFHDDLLVGSEFTSSWAGDSTNFDATKITSIEEKKTTVDGVVKLFGQPTGEYMFPVLENKGERALIYRYSQTKVFGLDIQVLDKKLVVSYDPSTKIVTAIDYVKSGIE
ncbi:hypothetical protein NBZ79_17510 [Sneathiella marina]|uniref:Lipoprotein n=1 Tax=Sneathiella marina TaxID=2950108 RepID=A0ABY4W1B2_9PROT|nr:hypothetical protein [Sneathiella marina]USG60958.1 hypothetical protein NBZ79_17510 [Sneathiella marina]